MGLNGFRRDLFPGLGVAGRGLGPLGRKPSSYGFAGAGFENSTLTF